MWNENLLQSIHIHFGDFHEGTGTRFDERVFVKLRPHLRSEGEHTGLIGVVTYDSSLCG
jgi:hypothetical protein